MFEKDAGRRKKSMIALRQPRTCSHPIYAYRSLRGDQDVVSLLFSYTASKLM